jgi:hypothetical protein
MKRYCLRALCFMSAMASLCCTGETIEFASDQGGSSSGSSDGGSPNDGSGGNVIGSPTEYRRSGYGGVEGWNGVVVQGDALVTRDEEFTACLNDGTVTRTIVDIDACTAATLCSPLCSEDSDCPRGGTAVPRCVECSGTNALGRFCTPSGTSACVLECALSSECPAEMACLPDNSGKRVCMFADMPWSPKCEGYCAELGGACDDDPQSSAPSHARCCEGLTCSAGRCVSE